MTAWPAHTILPTAADDLVERVMVSEQEFQSFMADLQAILDACGVPLAEQAELKAIVESIRGLMVDRAGTEGPPSAGSSAPA